MAMAQNGPVFRMFFSPLFEVVFGRSRPRLWQRHGTERSSSSTASVTSNCPTRQGDRAGELAKLTGTLADARHTRLKR
jgi:hypothetical protein